MTANLLDLAAQVQATLLAGCKPGHVGPPRPLPPVPRDAWASLLTWHNAGQRVWRIREERPCPGDLDLSRPPVAKGQAYQMPDRAEWIVLARLEAGEVVPVRDRVAYAFPEAMITWLGSPDAQGRISAGCINLPASRTWDDLWITPGDIYRRDGTRQALHSDDLSPDERKLALALPYWLGGGR